MKGVTICDQNQHERGAVYQKIIMYKIIIVTCRDLRVEEKDYLCLKNYRVLILLLAIQVLALLQLLLAKNI